VNTLLLAAGLMGGMGTALATVLALAWRTLRVKEDPRIDGVEKMLSGANCGACGKPGCRAFAEAVVRGEAPPSGCTVSTLEALEAITDYLGVDAGTRIPRVARLHCAGGRRHGLEIADYEGLGTCLAAHAVAGGGKSCPKGCLGLGDCAKACAFDVIVMNEDLLPVVDPSRCTACGACVTACPRDLFEILPRSFPLVVQCSLPLAGEQARALCAVACDGCGRCALDAPAGLITMKNDLPVVNLDMENAEALAHPRATWRCPTGAIRWVEDRQFVEAPSRASVTSLPASPRPATERTESRHVPSR
jgi:Na+-translocating ferredoxin:NAD+ oxidoreductase RNF subunit RnfB